MEELIGKLPDDEAQRELGRLLRSSEREHALAVIHKILSSDERPVRHAGLKLAAQLLRGRSEFTAALDIGLARKDVSDIRPWLLMFGSAMGFPRLLEHMEKVASADPERVVCAWYQLVPMIREKASEQVNTLRRVEATVDSALENGVDDVKAYWQSVKAAVRY
jgi:cobalamin biosynthesis protein CobD/CbiB